MLTDGGALFQQMAMVGLVLLLLGLCLWALHRRGVLQTGAIGRFRPRDRRLESLERLPLTPQHSLHLVKLEGRTLVLGVSPNSVSLLETLPETESSECPATDTLETSAPATSWAIGPLKIRKEMAK